jgi:hypothetical protein
MCLQYTIKVNGKSYIQDYFAKSSPNIHLTSAEKYAKVFTKKNEVQEALTKCIAKYKSVELIVSEVRVVRRINYKSE